jgi:hypothetical protein
MSTLFQRNRLSILERVMKIVYMGHRHYISMKHQFWNTNDQFNGKIEKGRPPPHLIGHEVYEMVKDAHVAHGKQKRTGKNIEEDDMWKKQSIFWELLFWKDLDIHHSIDLMHTEKNVCVSLLETLLNTDEKTRDH